MIGQTQTQKKKMSTSTWILIFFVIGILIVIAILALLGIIDTSPVTNAFLSYKMWASTELFNSILDSLAFFGLGVLVFYTVKTYIIGNKVTSNLGYTPPGQTVTPVQNKDTTTTVS